MILLLMALLLAAAFAAAAVEAALAFAVRERSEAMAHRLGRLEALQALYARRAESLLALRAVKTAASVAFAAALALELARRLPGWSWPEALAALAAILAAIFLVAEVLPRAAARPSADALAVSSAPAVLLLARAAAPLRLLQRAASRAIGRLPPDAPGPWHLPEMQGELSGAIQEAERLGELDEDAAGMIAGVLRLRKTEASAVMTPRPEIVSVERSTPLAEALATAAASGHSRLPVFEGTRDRIVGVLDTREALASWDRPEASREAGALMRAPFFVPVGKPIMDLLKELRREPSRLAVVLDEYGGTAGLVTVDDILKEVVGSLAGEGAPRLRWTGPGVAECDARMRIGIFNAEFGARLPEDPAYETLAGFALSCLEHLPSSGERFSHGSLDFTVLAATDRRIQRLRAVSGGAASGRDTAGGPA